eukprot:3196132-Rhodomonas_salina.1
MTKAKSKGEDAGEREGRESYVIDLGAHRQSTRPTPCKRVMATSPAIASIKWTTTHSDNVTSTLNITPTSRAFTSDHIDASALAQ